jgi:hypothetical protein
MPSDWEEHSILDKVTLCFSLSMALCFDDRSVYVYALLYVCQEIVVLKPGPSVSTPGRPPLRGLHPFWHPAFLVSFSSRSSV